MFVDSWLLEHFLMPRMAGIDAVEPGGSTGLIGVDFDYIRIEMMDWIGLDWIGLNWGVIDALVECGRAQWS